MVSRKKCKDIALSIFIPFFNIVQAIFWSLICLDNARVFEPLYSRAVGRPGSNPNSKYEPIMKTLEATLSCDFKLVAAKLFCDFKIPALVPIITINICLIIITLMRKSSLEYWKWAEEKAFLTFKLYLTSITVSFYI